MHPYTKLLFFVLTLASGCATGGEFKLHVFDERFRRTPASFSVYDPDKDYCYGGRSWVNSGYTDDGLAYVLTRKCGEAWLVVTAKGFKPYSELTDICSAEELTVQLAPMRPEPEGDPDLIANAEKFFKAARGGNAAALRELLADASDLETYSEGGPPVGLSGPCYLRRTRVTVDNVNQSSEPNATVQLAVICRDGCYSSWNVHMTKLADGWRGRSVKVATAEEDELE